MSGANIKTKNEFISILKGFAIFLMLWGHSIQYCAQGSFDFFENVAFKIIYSFHMPLFMIISGYLFYYSFEKRDLKELIVHRSKPLLWAIIVCSAFNYIITTGVYNVYSEHSVLQFFNGAILSEYKSLWFLWGVLAASIGVSVICKKVNKVWLQIILLIIWGVVVCIFPSAKANIYVYPYFIIGFYFAWHKKRFGVNRFAENAIKLSSILLFAVALFFYEKKHYIYTTGLYSSSYTFFENVGIDLFRWVIGLLGCVAIISVIEFLYNQVTKKCDKKLPLSHGLSLIGDKSLQMYSLSVSLLSFWLPKIYAFAIKRLFGYNVLAHNIYLYNFVYTPIIAIVYSVGIYYLIKLFEKIKFSKILFGK